jgi:hypothetical protein
VGEGISAPSAYVRSLAVRLAMLSYCFPVLLLVQPQLVGSAGAVCDIVPSKPLCT